MLVSPVLAVAAFASAVSLLHPGTAPRVVGLADSGRTISAQHGARLELRLPGQLRWTPPRVRGRAVALTRIVFIRDPGYLAWSVVARARGTATVTAVGYGEQSIRRTCDPGPCRPRLLHLSFVVR